MPLQKLIVILAACAACAGSVHARSPDAASVMPGRLKEVGYLSDADLLSEEWSQQFQAARRLVRLRQCETRAPNPLVYISPPLGGGNAASGELPLRVSTVANVPNEYLKDMTSLSEAPGMPPEMAAKLRRDLPANYEKLSARVRLLIGEYDPRNCYRRGPQQRRWSDIIDMPVNP
jgi:hypothetical protein